MRKWSYCLIGLRNTDGTWAIVLYSRNKKHEFSIILSAPPYSLISFGPRYFVRVRGQFDPHYPPPLSGTALPQSTGFSLFSTMYVLLFIATTPLQQCLFLQIPRQTSNKHNVIGKVCYVISILCPRISSSHQLSLEIPMQWDCSLDSFTVTRGGSEAHQQVCFGNNEYRKCCKSATVRTLLACSTMTTSQLWFKAPSMLEMVILYFGKNSVTWTQIVLANIQQLCNN